MKKNSDGEKRSVGQKMHQMGLCPGPRTSLEELTMPPDALIGLRRRYPRSHSTKEKGRNRYVLYKNMI